ncbi:hypothetical protein CEXT_733451 [Caerostris extrusa]|uniref:Uncharacterized protein n=1 Tax=Caerostris extrusa TaxID=172846 RepID=A0AAV4NI48_CAEEX|nr:hypothetical protein CEXT_733451 [Caerostris extrusa]
MSKISIGILSDDGAMSSGPWSEDTFPKWPARSSGLVTPHLEEITGKDHTDPQTLETTFGYRDNNNNQLIAVVLAKLHPTIGLYEICLKSSQSEELLKCKIWNATM